MLKLRPLIVGLLIVLVLVFALSYVVSAFYPPAIYRCSVYVDDGPAPAGLTVRAYVGTETSTRPGAEAVTNEFGVAILQVPVVTTDELTPSPAEISFTVEYADATETPDVDMTMEAPDVRLDVTDISPPPDVATWSMLNGIDEDLAAVNIWQYPEDAVQVTLADIEDAVPAELMVLWHYAGPGDGWQWFRPGWAEGTLDNMDPGAYYIGIILSECQWEIPQA
jgi:hypothetical protein